MFLWVKFAIRDLNKPASNAVLKERLKHLPYGLKQTYRHIIATLVEKLDDIDRKLAHTLLSLIAAARRPLKLDELQYAVAIATWLDSKSTKPFEFSEFAAAHFVPQLISLCGHIISISDQTVSLVHTSAKEFLLDSETEHIIKRTISSPARAQIQDNHIAFSTLSASDISILVNSSLPWPLANCQPPRGPVHYSSMPRKT